MSGSDEHVQLLDRHPLSRKIFLFVQRTARAPFLREFSTILSSVWRDKFNRIPKNPFILKASKNMLKFIEVLRAPTGTNFPSIKRKEDRRKVFAK